MFSFCSDQQNIHLLREQSNLQYYNDLIFQNPNTLQVLGEFITSDTGQLDTHKLIFASNLRKLTQWWLTDTV